MPKKLIFGSNRSFSPVPLELSERSEENMKKMSHFIASPRQMIDSSYFFFFSRLHYVVSNASGSTLNSVFLVFSVFVCLYDFSSLHTAGAMVFTPLERSVAISLYLIHS